MVIKRCIKCGIEKPISEFSRHVNTKSGYRNTCKACSKIEKKEWDVKNREHVLAYKKQHYLEHADENREYSKKYHREHLEQCREYDRKRYPLIKDKKREYGHQRHQAYYLKNKDKINQGIKEYQDKNPEKVKAYKRKNKIMRKALLSQVICDFTPGEWLSCLRIFDKVCAYCGKHRKSTIEHVIPVIHGGIHSKNNIIPACASCNSSKNSSDMETWYKKRPFYSAERLEKIKTYLSKG